MTQSPLTRCPNCGQTLTMASVTGATATSDMGFLAVGLVCHRCNQASHLKVDRQDWIRMLEAHGQKQPKAQPPKGSEVSTDQTESTGVDLRKVGRQVGAFAKVDLAPIRTVADIQLFWDYQERTDWASVPKERIR